MKTSEPSLIDLLAALAEQEPAAGDAPKPFLAGTFALYSRAEDGGVTAVLDVAEANGVDIPLGEQRLSVRGGMLRAIAKMTQVRGMFGR